MLIYIFRRLLVALSVMLTVAVVSFMLLHLSGDLATAIAGPESSAADVEKIRVQYGLDRPIASQFFDWLGAALRLDFGRSFYFQGTVIELIGERLPVTLKLGGVALLLLGHGLLNTLLTLRGIAEGYSTGMVGLLMSGYFAGFFIGTFFAPSLIGRIGHIRAFAFFAALAAIAVLLHPLWLNAWLWGLLRIIRLAQDRVTNAASAKAWFAAD